MSNLLNRQTLIATLLGLGISAGVFASAPTPATAAERETRIAAHFAQADSNKDGKLSLDEFKAMKQQQHTEHAEHRAEQRNDRREHGAERMQEHFTKADTNRDGQISKAEAQREMPRLFEKFDQLDSNKDGQLSKAEVVAGHARHHEH